MTKYTIAEVYNRDPASYTDPMETILESNPPSLIPDGFVIYENELYYYIYSQWSDENWAELRDLPADNGWHMRTYFVYNFENLYANHGMWQDSAAPLPLTPEFTEPPGKGFDPPPSNVPPPDYSGDIEYMAAAHNMYGLFAVDNENVYYKNLNDNGNLYKKLRDTDDAGVKLADANEHGYLYGISVYGDEVFYATQYFDENTPDGTDGHGGPTVYAVKRDGTSETPTVVLKGAGDDFYIYGGVFYFTGGEYSSYTGLNSVPYESGKPLDTSKITQIDDFAMHMSVADGKITYSDGVNIIVYDIASGKNILTKPLNEINAVDGLFLYGDKVIFHYTYGAESRLYNVLSSIDIKTGEIKDIDSRVFDRNEEINNGSALPVSLSIFEGQIWYNTLQNYKSGGYHARVLNGFLLEWWDDSYGSVEESIALPFGENPPECALFATPDGLYQYGRDGVLEKYEFGSL
jgi:hypothetical protein